MTVEQLINVLKDYPGDTPVVAWTILLNTAEGGRTVGHLDDITGVVPNGDTLMLEATGEGDHGVGDPKGG